MSTAEYGRTWDSRDAFLNCTGRGISVTSDGVSLRRGFTVADETGRCGRNDRERIAGLRQARKTFDLPVLGRGRVLLCPFLDCDTEGGELEVLVNGHTIRYQRPTERSYWEDRWTQIEIPAGRLVVGRNDVVFKAVGESIWRLLIEPGRFPDRSDVSEDGGQTWRSDELGENDGTDGEYMVRLWLDQHAESGELCSQPVDLLETEGGVASTGAVESFTVDAVGDFSRGDLVRLQWRGGPLPAYQPDTWTAWAPAAGTVEPPGFVRFVEWRALLSTDDPDTTPLLKSISLSARVSVEQPALLRVESSDNAPLVRSSYRFATTPAASDRAARLRERWHLDDVVRGAQNDFEAFLRLRSWVREQWEDGWNMGEIDFCPPWDAMVILELASRKLSLGMCTHYATVMSHCCAALGLTARTQIMRSHCINEVWSDEHGKWVAMDVGGDADDETKFTYHLERNGVPLSALEAHNAWVEKDFDDITVSPQPPAATEDRFEVAKRLKLFERFMISLRNDELVTMSPGEPEHGKISYHFDDYLFWRDEQTEPLPWFSRSTGRPGDLYWTANRARIHLKQSAAGHLEVLLETETPNLAGFERRLDDGDWSPCEAHFDWQVVDESGTLAARPVNAFGRRGSVSQVTVGRGD